MRLLFVVVLILIAAGGGLFATSIFAPNILPPFVLEILGQEASSEKPPIEVERPSATETVLIDLEPMEIPLFKDNAVDRSLFMHILIEVLPGENADLVNGNILRIIDVFITYIHALNALDIKPGLNDRAFLKDRLMVKAEEIVGEGIIIDLLFVNIFERPFR